MWKKIALNVFYNLGIIVSGMGIYWSYNNDKSLLLIGLFALTCALFVYLKINLVKTFKAEAKEYRGKTKDQRLK